MFSVVGFQCDSRRIHGGFFKVRWSVGLWKAICPLSVKKRNDKLDLTEYPCNCLGELAINDCVDPIPLSLNERKSVKSAKSASICDSDN